MSTAFPLPDEAKAILLLTSHFSKTSYGNEKPLTISEWRRFESWLKQNEASPAELLKPNLETLLEKWRDNKVSCERITHLLSRSHSLALAVEKWHRANLWWITQSDRLYPPLITKRLHCKSPPVLFGCGNQELLDVGGLAVVGSRNADKNDLGYAEQIGVKAATEGIAIVSGGARGVDEASMLGAMKSGGSVIGVLADNLLKTATSSKWRTGLMENRVALVSPFYPEAGFNIGHAMQRNQYIYCLSNSAMVVHCGNKGGTLTGARENLKRNWVPLWVKPTNDRNTANEELVNKGGCWVKAKIDDLKVADLVKGHNSDSCKRHELVQERIRFGET